MKKLIVANWKMNFPNMGPWRNFRAEKGVDVVVCPPFPYLRDVSNMVRRGNIELGAQDVFWGESGAYTGEVSAKMLKGIGVKYVIVGHSERRKWFHETDEVVNKKVKAALSAGLKVILCVGESAAVRERGFAAAKKYVGSQLKKGLRGILNSQFSILNSRLIVAYEPIWAIGTGRADKPADTAAMAKFIKNLLHSSFSILHSRLLYGGSVNGKNAGNFLKYREINGALVGGASLKVNEFKKIIKNASKHA